MVLEQLWGTVVSFLFWFFVPILGVVVLAGVTYPFWIGRLFPIRFIVFKNAGGAKGNDTIVFAGIKKGMIRKKGQSSRVWILGHGRYFSPNLVSREHAVVGNGGIYFMIYEKEPSQFFPIKPSIANIDVVLPKEKEVKERVVGLYESLKKSFPDLASYIKLVTDADYKKVSPMVFSNHEVKLRPVPVDMITQYAYDVRLMGNKYKRKGFWERYGYTIVGMTLLLTLIIVAVLTFDYLADFNSKVLGEAQATREGIAELISNRLAGGSAPAPLVFFLPPVLFSTFQTSFKKGGRC